MHYQSRGGVRGGQDQFKWDNVKLMSYKDRECYLGASSKVGFLDKGGKWRRRDWYAQSKDPKAAAQDRKEELALIKLEEKAMMNFRLGIADEYNKGCTDIKQVLNNVHNQNPVSSLSTVEIKELTRRGGEGEDHHFDDGYAAADKM